MQTSIDVIGIGAMNMDHLYSVRNLVIDGEDVIDDFGRYPGGSAANTIYALSKLGLKTGFVGVVGSDDDGRSLINDFAAVGVDTSHVRVATGAITGAVLALSDRLGRRSLYISPGANNLLNPADIDLDYLNSARMVHISSFVHDDQFTLLVDTVRQLSIDVKLSFSPGSIYASKGLKPLTPILDRTSVLFINRIEIERMTGTSYTKAAWECIKRGCETVVVTLGHGLTVSETRTIVSYIRDREREYQVEAINVPFRTVDTTGAGDAFAAGFIYAMLNEKSPVECAKAGDIVAKLSINERGARSALPTREQLMQHYLQYTGKAF